MSGSDPYTLDILYGENLVGKLKLGKASELSLTYTDEWQEQGFPLSPHLPFGAPISSLAIRKYLQNLLPENQGLDHLIEYLGVTRNNIFRLVGGIGYDASGAMLFVPEGQRNTEQTLFRPIEDAEIITRLSGGAYEHLEVWDGRPRLSVAGVQSKLNVLCMDDRIGLADGDLCSTHIIKFEKANQRHLVLNEFVTMTLAKFVGLDVAEVSMRYFGEHPALLVERFDRRRFGGVVRRRHVIDGCQATDMGVDHKYERNLGTQRDVAHIRDGVSFVRLFDLSDHFANPAGAKLRLLEWALFNLLVGNADSHGKNFSFFVSFDGLQPTPLYDLVNVAMYPEFEQDLAMAFGDEFNPAEVNAYQLLEFAEECGIAKLLLQRTLVRLVKAVLAQIQPAIEAYDNLTLEQIEYLERYAAVVRQRANHLKEQMDELPTIEL
ncbi:HipA domain-containing protein [Vibrio breoganii]|uniref:Type II toxin-antitoxin system HipA family toxin n=1 Tax=Vibrio breoganii TaxID=553239 RepID=A0ABX1UC18_9VIBR|nr:HipA domain-containing protein [Vibrio breoganii]NMO74105.1 type II toxin-antitoxin system HipA family toxin [Vibrio breoganii]NMR70850.1 type II toxin-antitoxin system HipA family toxin [Vibrio breoganii]PMK30146.1 phosphatidylinositol kinase [Vibrio breoganii]PMK33148.1 phosphatidylinositol kinase [Vibrio breoganii]PMK68030.1 phosphatidylinositol kinase [Vibrio breoganii]